MRTVESLHRIYLLFYGPNGWLVARGQAALVLWRGAAIDTPIGGGRPHSRPVYSPRGSYHGVCRRSSWQPLGEKKDNNEYWSKTFSFAYEPCTC